MMIMSCWQNRLPLMSTDSKHCMEKIETVLSILNKKLTLTMSTDYDAPMTLQSMTWKVITTDHMVRVLNSSPACEAAYEAAIAGGPERW